MDPYISLIKILEIIILLLVIIILAYVIRLLVILRKKLNEILRLITYVNDVIDPITETLKTPQAQLLLNVLALVYSFKKRSK